MINPPLGCSREDFIAFVKTLEEGERVVEAGASGMQWETGVTVLSRHGNGMCVRWDTKFEEGSGRVSGITEGTRRLIDFPDHPAAYLLAKGQDEFIPPVLPQCTLSAEELLTWASEECANIVNESYPIADTGDYHSAWYVYANHLNEDKERCIGCGETIRQALKTAWIEEHTKDQTIAHETCN